MRKLRPDSRTVAVAVAIVIAASMLVAIVDALDPVHLLNFAGLLVTATLISALGVQTRALDRGAMPPSFVAEFASLILFGPWPTTLIAAAGPLMAGQLTRGNRSGPPWRLLLQAVAAISVTVSAGVVHRLLGGTPGAFVGPSQSVPIAAAAVVYALLGGGLAQIVGRFEHRPLNRTWMTNALRECPLYFIGAGFAVGLAEVLDHRLWQVLPLLAVPLYFAYRAYGQYVSRLDAERRHEEVINSLDHGIAVLDGDGRVNLWNDAVERLVSCPRARILGRPLMKVLPALRKTALPTTIEDALIDRQPRTISGVNLSSAAGPRVAQIQVLPSAGGVTLLWHDVTDRTRAELALRRSTERLDLVADGANDGLWEWDLRTREFYVSGRWRAMLGLPANATVARPEVWLDRVHPDDIAGLHEAIEAHMSGKADLVEHEHRIKHEDGSYRWFLCRGVGRGAGRRPACLGGSLTDTSERVSARERLRTAGFLDPLTGLRNRTDFVHGLGRRLEALKQHPTGRRFAVLYLDLDRFKVVNDSLGHMVGDELLIVVSRRLESCLRPGDSLGRLGGDEFAILLDGLDDEGQANAIAFRIQDALSAAMRVSGREVFTSASIGIAFGNPQYDNPDEIMRDADTAMYHAKSRGKARHELFDADMHARARDRLGLESDLRHAVDNNDFDVHYQPIVLLASRMCVGFESLVRWTRAGEAIPPSTFVPIAEELGLIESGGTWVLRQACRTFADWQRRYPGAGLEYITVNASSRQLTQQSFPLDVERAVQKSGLKPAALRIEITETALMDSPQLVAGALRQLRDFGVKVYLDDFGTGCSSLSHLHKLPVDALKIDRSFVRSLVLPDRPAIVESILALARTMQTGVVAEGIETHQQACELERLGCTHAQGFLFSRPLSTRAAEELIVRNRPLGPPPPPLAAVGDSTAAASVPWTGVRARASATRVASRKG
jgi:diguanylate cyclase (GGDEF)-like protein/PAS domain S-box-containing protein